MSLGRFRRQLLGLLGKRFLTAWPPHPNILHRPRSDYQPPTATCACGANDGISARERLGTEPLVGFPCWRGLHLLHTHHHHPARHHHISEPGQCLLGPGSDAFQLVDINIRCKLTTRQPLRHRSADIFLSSYPVFYSCPTPSLPLSSTSHPSCHVISWGPHPCATTETNIKH